MRASVAVGVFLSALAGAAGARAEDKPSALEFPTFGVTARAPEGWRHIPEGGAGHIARWAKLGAKEQVQALLTLEIVPARDQKLEEYAKGIARSTKGTLAAETTKLGGETAYKVDAKAGAKLGAVGAVVAEHAKHFYVIGAFASSDVDLAKEIDALRESVTFTAFESPTKHLALRDEATTIFGMKVKLPTTLRPFTTKDPRTEIQGGIFDYTRGALAFSVNFTTIAKGPKQTHAEFRESFGTKLQQKLGVETPLTWTEVGQKPARWLTSAATAGAENAKQTIRFALVEIADDRVGLLAFTTTVAEDVKAYDGLAEKILGGLALAAE